MEEVITSILDMHPLCAGMHPPGRRSDSLPPGGLDVSREPQSSWTRRSRAASCLDFLCHSWLQIGSFGLVWVRDWGLQRPPVGAALWVAARVAAAAVGS